MVVFWILIAVCHILLIVVIFSTGTSCGDTAEIYCFSIMTLFLMKIFWYNVIFVLVVVEIATCHFKSWCAYWRLLKKSTMGLCTVLTHKLWFIDLRVWVRTKLNKLHSGLMCVSVYHVFILLFSSRNIINISLSDWNFIQCLQMIVHQTSPTGCPLNILKTQLSEFLASIENSGLGGPKMFQSYTWDSYSKE